MEESGFCRFFPRSACSQGASPPKFPTFRHRNHWTWAVQNVRVPEVCSDVPRRHFLQFTWAHTGASQNGEPLCWYLKRHRKETNDFKGPIPPSRCFPKLNGVSSWGAQGQKLFVDSDVPPVRLFKGNRPPSKAHPKLTRNPRPIPHQPPEAGCPLSTLRSAKCPVLQNTPKTRPKPTLNRQSHRTPSLNTPNSPEAKPEPKAALRSHETSSDPQPPRTHSVCRLEAEVQPMRAGTKAAGGWKYELRDVLLGKKTRMRESFLRAKRNLPTLGFPVVVAIP